MFKLVYKVAILAVAHAQMEVIDMTHALSSNTIYWPGNPDYNFTILFRGQNDLYW